jgi:hypothetical protein
MITIRMSRVGLGLIAWLTTMLGVAHAADIQPVARPGAPLGSFPYTVKASSSVTLAIFQGGVDKTDTWLPEPEQAVQLKVKINGVIQSPPPTIQLVAPAAGTVNGVTNPFLNAQILTTSAYPGRCGNTDNPAPPQNAPDYTLSGDMLTPTDCGGFAVVNVTVPAGVFTFIVPQDSNANGIPDIYETQFCNTVPCPTGAEDGDLRPTASPLVGDVAGALDEYRGYMIRGNHIRTDPRQVDIFVYLVNPQCTGEQPGFPSQTARDKSRLGGSTILTTYPTTGNGALFDGLSALYGQAQIHLMHALGATNYKSTDFVDKFSRYEVSLGQLYVAAAGGETSTPPADDRQINKNAVLSGNLVQKVIRVIECVALPPPATPLGIAGTISVNASGYAILYTQRIISNLQSLVDAGAGRTLRFSTYQGGRATSPVVVGSPTLQSSKDYVISQAMKFYATHEVLHTGDLVPPLGGHDAVGDGNFLDAAIMTKVDSKTSGFNTFYIPTLPDSVSSLYKSNYLVE